MTAPKIAEKLLDYFERHFPATLNKALAELNLTDDDWERAMDYLDRKAREGDDR